MPIGLNMPRAITCTMRRPEGYSEAEVSQAQATRGVERMLARAGLSRSQARARIRNIQTSAIAAQVLVDVDDSREVVDELIAALRS